MMTNRQVVNKLEWRTMGWGRYSWLCFCATLSLQLQALVADQAKRVEALSGQQKASSFVLKNKNATRSQAAIPSKEELKEQLAREAWRATQKCNALGQQIAGVQQELGRKWQTVSADEASAHIKRAGEAASCIGQLQSDLFALQQKLANLIEGVLEGHVAFKRTRTAYMSDSLKIVTGAASEIAALPEQIKSATKVQEKGADLTTQVCAAMKDVKGKLGAISVRFTQDRCLKKF